MEMPIDNREAKRQAIAMAITQLQLAGKRITPYTLEKMTGSCVDMCHGVMKAQGIAYTPLAKHTNRNQGTALQKRQEHEAEKREQRRESEARAAEKVEIKRAKVSLIVREARLIRAVAGDPWVIEEEEAW